MSPKAFVALLGVTIVSLVLAGRAIATRDVPGTGAVAPSPMFQGLLDRLGDVAEIDVEAGGAATTINRTKEGWVVAEKGGYPADPAKVKELARGLAGLDLVEAKTADPDRLGRLDLGDPAKAGARSKLVTLKDASGQTIAAAVIGKEKSGLFGGGRGGVYARRDGEDRAWLASGDIDVPAKPIDWLDKKVVDVPEAEVAKVTLDPDGAAPITVGRPDRKAAAFDLAPLPDGRAADQEKLQRLASALAGLELQDVRKADAAPPADARKVRFETFDGLVVEAVLTSTGEGDKAENWVTLRASEAPALAAPAAAVAPAGDAGTAAPPPPPPPPPTPATLEPVAKRVAELERRLDGWAFELPKYLADRLAWGETDLLKKPDGTS